jgi:hypothetical protein
METTKRLAFLVPGIFGSTLSVPGQGEIWGPDFHQNYKLVSKKSVALAWSNTKSPASASLMREVYGTNMLSWRIWKKELWTGTIHVLNQCPGLRPNDVVEVGYDWRDSILNLSSTLSRIVNSHLDASTDNGESKAVLITHSMGGMLARVAISKGELTTSRIDRIIHMGTPLLGAPTAFASLYATFRFPFLEAYMKWSHFRNTALFRENLFDCVRTFDSAWELLPQDIIKYIRHSGRYGHVNPLDEGYIPSATVDRVRRVHELVNQAGTILANAGVPVYFIHTGTHRKPTEIEYEVTPEATPNANWRYKIHANIPTFHGDGTVPAYSAGGNRVNPPPVLNVSHDDMCNDATVTAILPGLLS